MNIIKQQFESYDVRFVQHPEDKYAFGIVASDLAQIVEVQLTKDLVSVIEDEYKGEDIIPTLGGEQKMTIIWEPGIYEYLSKSRKPKAKPFKKWLFEEVLPSIRKTGSYNLKPLTPAEMLLQQAQFMVETERRQKALEEQQLILQQSQVEVKAIALEARDGLSQVRDQLASLKEFAVAQPPGLAQDQADLINQAFQLLGATLLEAGITTDRVKAYKTPWRDLGLTMRNSSINYDLNARHANAIRNYEVALADWEANGKPRGKKPQKPSRIALMLKDNVLTDGFKAAQQVVSSTLSKLSK